MKRLIKLRSRRTGLNMQSAAFVMFIFAGNNGSGNAIRQMHEAKENGFEVIMFYVGLGDYRLNIDRVAARVKNGGHDIPTEDIIRRDQTSIKNLLANLYLLDHLIIIDNSDLDGVIVLEADFNHNVIKYMAEITPNWVKTIEQRIKMN